MRSVLRLLVPILAALALTPVAEAHGPQPTQVTPATERLLYVEWHGSWWAAQELERTKTGSLVHYLGWSSSWDEEVGGARMRHADPQGRLHVEWGGSYWAATILRSDGENRVRVHYDGWGQEWDESVSRTRLVRLR